MKKRWVLATLVIIMILYAAGTGIFQEVRRDDLIRLHVIANSDSPEDQALKLRVRDQLLLRFGQIFKDARTMDQARALIEANLEELEKTALAEINNQGYDYQVSAQLGIFPFPTKVYGNEVYPAGRYEALRVVIGEGKGANWWCVMFPPLCFVDVSTGVTGNVNEDAADMEADTGSRDYNQNEVVYTFKLAEWWSSFRQWLGNIFS